jgi:hypothetical protein
MLRDLRRRNIALARSAAPPSPDALHFLRSAAWPLALLLQLALLLTIGDVLKTPP